VLVAGSEIYQEMLVKGLAQHMQANLLVFDSARVYLEVSISPISLSLPSLIHLETSFLI
jgi:hypothetical protein